MLRKKENAISEYNVFVDGLELWAQRKKLTSDFDLQPNFQNFFLKKAS